MPTQTSMIRDDDNPNETDLVAGSILDDLSPEEADRLNQAIAQSPVIASEIESFREAFALLPYDMPLLEPSARLKDKIISAALQPAVVPHPDPTGVQCCSLRPKSSQLETMDTCHRHEYCSRSSHSAGVKPGSTELAGSANGCPSATA